MSLMEVEEISGVPVEYILNNLNMPPDVPTEERLGRLKRSYHFEMAEVKNAIRKYHGENH
jgi:hypothetical protein